MIDRDSSLSLDGFEVVPEIPGSQDRPSNSDSDDASPLTKVYCNQLTKAQYEMQVADETEKALQVY